MRYSLKNPFYKSSLAIAVTGAILSGCGGGSDGGASSGSGGGQTTSGVALSGLVTGRVADGYIMGATAFLDIDGDKQLDSWEPNQKTEVLDTTVSTNDDNLGKFEVDLATWFDELSAENKALVLGYLQDAGLSTADGTTLTAGDLMSAFSVVVDIPADAVDADKPTETIGSAIKLAAPPKPKVSGSTSSETFISPITTVLDQKVTAKKKELKEKEALGLTVTEDEKDVAQLVSAAKKEVKTDLGLDETASDDLLTGDYIGAKDDADSTKSDLAKKLHTVAKVTTTLLAKGVNDTTGGSDNTTQLDDATRQAIIDAVTEKVLAQLKTIAAVSQKIVDEGGDEDVASIDVNKISEKAQEVAAEDTSSEGDAASLTEVTVDQDEIEAAKEATEQAQQDDTADDTTDTVLTAFLSDAPKQIVRGTTGNTLTYRELGLSEASATWATDSTLPGTSSVTTSVLDQDTGEWVEVSVASSISGTTQTLTFTPTAPVAEAPLAESEETVQTPAAITADTPLTLTRTLSGTVTDLAGKSIRAQVGVPNWKEKITAGTTFTNGTSNPQRARLVAQSASSVTLKLADTLSYNGLKAQVVDGTVSFTDLAGNTVTSFITDTVTASDGAFTVPADIAARFNIPADQRDWVDVAGVLGYQLGKNPVIFDWFNATAFDQIATEALNTDGLVNSPNLVASLSGDTVTVNAASLLIPEGYSLSTVEAVKPALYGKGVVLTEDSSSNQFSLSQGDTARVTLTYISATAGAEPITQTGYIHRGKDTADSLVAGRDYKVRSKIQWNPTVNEGAGAYEHALEVLLRESRYADLKAATMSGEAIVGTAEVPEDYQVEGIYRVYGPKTVAAGAAPAFDLDGIVDTAAETITLPAVPATKPADLSAVTASAIAFDGQQLTFTSLAASGAANATDICFDLSLTSGTDTVEKLECAGKPSTDGSYALDLSQLGLNLRAFDSIAISGLTLKESIEGVEVTQTKAITNASVLEKGSLAQQALSGETLYLTAHNETEDTYTYLTVSYNPDTGSWSIIRVNSTGGDNSESPVTMATISGGTLQFGLDGVTSSLVFNANTAEDLTDVTWTQGESTVYLVKQENEASFIQWKNDHATKVFYTNLFRQTPFSAGQGTTCSGSGYKIESGFDLNGNKILDNEEISLTQEVCNGQVSDISVVRLDGSTSQCADVGGTRLDITGQEPILLCNSDGTPRNYPQAKELALGFGTWVNALESHAVKVSDSVETQTAELDALVSNDGIDTSMMGLQFAIYALDAAHRQFVQTASTTAQTYDMATLIPELERPSELVSLAGSVAVGVDVDGQPNTLTLTDFSADIDADLLDETNPVITTTVTMDPMSVPALTAASTFSWTMANVIAKANDGTQDIGQVTAPSVQATLTTTNDITLVGQTAEAGLSSVSLDLGSETSPVRIETLNSPADIASERVFTGFLTLNADLQQFGYQPSRKPAPQKINLSFNGQLEYNSQTLAIDLGLNAPQIQQVELSSYDFALDELNTGTVLTGWKTVTAINGVDEPYYNTPSYSGTLQSLTRYEFADRSGDSRSYALAEISDSYDGSISYQVWRVQSTDWGEVEYDWNDYQTFSSLADAQKAVLASGLTGYSYYGSNSETQIWAHQRVYSASNQWDSLEIGGYYDLGVVSLPEVGAAATSYDLNVDYVDYDQTSSSRFDNHSLYTATAGFSLKNLKGFDAAGVPSVLPDVALTVEAARTSYIQGDTKFTLSFEGEELTARYHHWDLFAYGESNDITGSLKDFSFTDNAGGLMLMDPTRVSCDWGDGWNGEYNYQDGEGLACALGASHYRLMVNGVDHGKVWQDQHGQWIAVLGDGDPNIDEKQQDEFVVYTPQ